MKACNNPVCVNPDRPEDGPHDGCNWLDWMVVDGGCPHCGEPVTDILTVTPLGQMLDANVDLGRKYADAMFSDRPLSTEDEAVIRDLLDRP